jgi:CheY-like chemotaxis protein
MPARRCPVSAQSDILGATMIGAFLDVHRGMKPVTCAVDPDFWGTRHVRAPREARHFSIAAKKSPTRVLVVDDEPLIRWSVSESLADAGCDVAQAADAISALRKITTAAPAFDVVVLDLRLPDMDDLSLLATVRQLVPGTRLVLMTAFGTPEMIAEAIRLGAAVISKPFELDILTRLVIGDQPDCH